MFVNRSDSETVALARRSFVEPAPQSRPTPLYWWSGGDLSEHEISRQLDELATMPIGGTIVGYAHQADNSLDHGLPEPFSPEWWSFLRWFTDESEARGLTVGFQDYGVLGRVFLEVGSDERSTAAGGTLHRSSVVCRGGLAGMSTPGEIVVAHATRHGEEKLVEADRVCGNRAEWDLPAGEWTLHAVYLETGQIQGRVSHFDPLAEGAGAAVINHFYRLFEDHLGTRLGQSFTMFFQDELDFGVRMPMWNPDVARRLEERGYPLEALHGLWTDLPDAENLRIAHLDVVVELLTDRYFQPIAQWMGSRGLVHLMDQMARGDLRSGALHYADFLRTMSTFSAPGHDDPDLFGPRNVTGATVSASIAAANGTHVVPVEAFHSSGWRVTPADIRREVNALFGLGMTHLVLHGLYSTTRQGQWEWAPPDFHFRQPWWPHSLPLWRHIHSISAVSRIGCRTTDVAVVDPTDELIISAWASDSPEVFARVVSALAGTGSGVTVISSAELAHAEILPGELNLPSGRYSTLIVPGGAGMRKTTQAAAELFASIGGTVIFATGATTPRAMAGTAQVPSEDREGLRRAIGHRRVFCDREDVFVSHRRLADGDLYIVFNPGPGGVVGLTVATGGKVETYHPHSGAVARTQVDDGACIGVAMERDELVIVLIETSRRCESHA